MEPNPSKDKATHEGDNPLFSIEFIQFDFFLGTYIRVRIFKQAPKYTFT
jgi:hypothetical protein